MCFINFLGEEIDKTAKVTLGRTTFGFDHSKEIKLIYNTQL